MGADDLSQSQLDAREREFLARLRTGDAEAIVALERRHGDELRAFCRRMLSDADAAQDIVQDVLTTCCRVEPEALPTQSIRGWLYQLARRRCIDALRKRRETAPPAARGVRRVQPTYDDAIDPVTTPAGRALKRDRAARLLAVLDELDDDLRSVVVMRYFQNLSREEIAEAVGLTLAGAKARLSKAMEVLREKLAGLDSSGAS
ncbi:MAG: RNA polymerase sigma factor [Phycisphaerae bacterium]